MSFLGTIFNELIFRPLLNLLAAVLVVVPGHNLGFAIILVTLLARIILYPLAHKSLKSQRKLSHLQPKIKELQEKHKENRHEQSQAIMKFYKEHNINPLGGCAPFLVQLPLIIGLYRVFLIDLASENLVGLYSFVPSPKTINAMFLGMSLKAPSLILAILAGLAQFFLSKITFVQKKKIGIPKSNQPDFQNIMGKQMTYVLPFVTIFIALRFPAGLVLYWFATTLFSIGQQVLINRNVDSLEKIKA